MRLMLARHGETDWNLDHRYQGQTDVRLNGQGRRDAYALAQRLRGTQIDAIYTSDLARARETAEIVAAAVGSPVRIDARLREMDFGQFEGLTYAEIEERYPEELARWSGDRLHVAPPGGETMGAVLARVTMLYGQVVQIHSDETVLWVAHGGSLRVLLCLALGLGYHAFWRFPLRNAALSELEVYDRGAVLNYLNDTAHLAPEGDQSPMQPKVGSRCILVLGGARSGKSTFAETLARQWGGERVLYVATAEPGDEEMRLRIAKHREERDPLWQTVEARRGVARALAQYPGEFDVVLLDCLTLLVANVLGEIDDPFSPEAVVTAEIEELLAWANGRSAYLLVVSNEVGLGLVPPYPLGRAYRDLLGRANQMVASGADEVYLLVAGLPLQLKGAQGLTTPLASILGS